MNDAARLAEMDRILSGLYPETTLLKFSDPWTLLVAAVLAAQCTDERVNQVTATLFDRYPGPAAFAAAPLAQLEQDIHSTGFFRQKAKTLKALGQVLTENHAGALPTSVDEMLKLPGVGRKTANLVRGNSMGQPAVFVDTHVGRLAARMGFSAQKDPDRVEADLAALIPEPRRTAFSNLLTHLGRKICSARKANCPACPVAALCPKIGV